VRYIIPCTADALVTQLEVHASQQVHVRKNLQPICPGHCPWSGQHVGLNGTVGQHCKGVGRLACDHNKTLGHRPTGRQFWNKNEQTCPYPEQNHWDQGNSRTVHQYPGNVECMPASNFALIGRSLANISVNRQFQWKVAGHLTILLLGVSWPHSPMSPLRIVGMDPPLHAFKIHISGKRCKKGLRLS
jgi:hypothetical protein